MAVSTNSSLINLKGGGRNAHQYLVCAAFVGRVVGIARDTLRAKQIHPFEYKLDAIRLLGCREEHYRLVIV